MAALGGLDQLKPGPLPGPPGPPVHFRSKTNGFQFLKIESESSSATFFLVQLCFFLIQLCFVCDSVVFIFVIQLCFFVIQLCFFCAFVCAFLLIQLCFFVIQLCFFCNSVVFFLCSWLCFLQKETSLTVSGTGSFEVCAFFVLKPRFNCVFFVVQLCFFQFSCAFLVLLFVILFDFSCAFCVIQLCFFFKSVVQFFADSESSFGSQPEKPSFSCAFLVLVPVSSCAFLALPAAGPSFQ